jgi:hypothetical protein
MMSFLFSVLCYSIKNYRGFHGVKLKFIVYNLGDLTQQQMDDYKIGCEFAEFRNFNHFHLASLQIWPVNAKYPRYVSHLRQYRWKSLIIAEALTQFPMVLWMDASMKFNNAKKRDSMEL